MRGGRCRKIIAALLCCLAVCRAAGGAEEPQDYAPGAEMRQQQDLEDGAEEPQDHAPGAEMRQRQDLENGAETLLQDSGNSAEEPLPQRWYAGDYGKKPTVQYQGKYGTCWALAAVSALEASLLPERHIVFSADHMSRNNAFTVDLDEGGDYLMTMAYLSGWQGPVTAEQDPYGDGYSPSGVEPAVHVQEIQVLENAEPEEIKRAVCTYGAVQTSLYMNRSLTMEPEHPGGEAVPCYNEAERAYLYPREETPNHDVIILGWDDAFPGSRFPVAASRDGAFICQNTWEEGFGGDGIFYVSYDDPNIAGTVVVYSRIDPTDNYARICQNDDCGWQGRQGYADETCWFANVYTAGEGEELAAVGFYATGRDTDYEIYFVPEFDGPESFGRRRYLQSGSLQNIGYYTVDLETPQELEAGARFAVVVKITTPGTENPVAVEYRADQYTQNVTTAGREGYVSQYGTYWENTQERFETNPCLKAYLREAGQGTLGSEQ